jgi:hypothetical protein
MSEETVVAAPSAAEETPASTSESQSTESTASESRKEIQIERGALVNLTPEQRTEFRKTGNLPTPPKKEAPAPSPEPKSEDQSESAAEADAAISKQEHTDKGKPKPKPSAEERIAQLEATIEKIRKGAGIERKADPAPAPEPVKADAPKAQAPPRNYQEWRKEFKPSQWIEEYAKANPAASYEDANAAMSDYLGDVRDEFRMRSEQQRSQEQELNSKVSEARQRYGEKFDEVLQPTLQTILGSQSVLPVVRQLINESEVLPDLLFTLGSNPEGLNEFLGMAPGKQARYIALTESLIYEALEAKNAPQEAVKAEPPAKPKTSAPKPPAEVGGRNSSPGDELESAARSGDYRRFKAEADRRAIARLKG